MLERGRHGGRRLVGLLVLVTVTSCTDSSASDAPSEDSPAVTSSSPPEPAPASDSPIAPDVAELDVGLARAGTAGVIPLGEPIPFRLSVRNRADRSMSVPIDLAIRPIELTAGSSVPTGDAVRTVVFFSTQLFVSAEGEAFEDIATTPAQWFGTSGRFEIAATVGGDPLGDPLVVDVGDAAVVVPRFDDVTTAAGIETTVPEAECGQFSNGAAWADVDGDGHLDLLVTRLGEPMALFVNDGSGHFADEAASRGLAVEDANNVSFADYDNDGDADVMVVRDGTDLLLANDGRGRFADVSARAGVGDDDRRGMNASWADYDNDGDLDVYVTNYMHCLGAWSTAEEVITQVAYDSDTLYRNDGDGTFVDVTSYVENDPDDYDDGITIGAGFGASWFDYDHDGRLDLYLANDFVGPQPDYNRLWHNDGPTSDGGWGFSDVSLDTNTALFMNTMGIGVGDYDRDGDFDMALSNITANKLLRNDGGTTFTETPEAGIGRPTQEAAYNSITWGVVFGDYNLDGWEDLYVSAGNLQQAPGVPTGDQPDEVFVNDGTGRFLDVSAATGADDPGESKGVAVADYDRDGDLDIAVVNQGGSPRLYQNVTPRDGSHWLTVVLEGTVSNRDGCGAVVRVAADSGELARIVSCGSGAGGSGNEHAVHFGLAPGDTASVLTIEWPSGISQTVEIAGLDRHLNIEEPAD
jgi:hypothetical protein